jgi:arylsulfatase
VSKHWSLAVACLVGIVTGCARDQPAGYGPPDRWNVLVVSFDALRADALPLYGYHRNTSPELAAFASSSVVYERAYAAAQATPTSFASAWSGQYPFRIFKAWRFTPDRSLADVLSAAGYATAFFGTNAQLVEARGFNRGFSTYRILYQAPSSGAEVGAPDDDTLLASAVEWLDGARRGSFFAWIHFLSPHSPYDRVPGSEAFYDPAYDGPFVDSVPNQFTAETPADRARVRDLYDGEVHAADRHFGDLMRRLDDWGVLDRTIVVVTADHGEEFQDHGQWGHASVHDEVVRVPLVVRHPNVREGVRVAAPVSNVDLLPSIASWLGLEPPDDLDGIALDLAPPADRLLLSTAMTGAGMFAVSIVRGPHKAVLDCQQRPAELYDLSVDPGATRNLASEQSHLLEELIRGAAGVADGDPCDVAMAAVNDHGPAPDLDAASLERLRALGYVGGISGTRRTAAVLTADPDPIRVCNGLGLGQTTISWWLPDTAQFVEVRVGAPTGPLFASGQGAGLAPTGLWVKDGTRFFLVAAADHRVLATLQVSLLTCDP